MDEIMAEDKCTLILLNRRTNSAHKFIQQTDKIPW